MRLDWIAGASGGVGLGGVGVGVSVVWWARLQALVLVAIVMIPKRKVVATTSLSRVVAQDFKYQYSMTTTNALCI